MDSLCEHAVIALNTCDFFTTSGNVLRGLNCDHDFWYRSSPIANGVPHRAVDILFGTMTGKIVTAINRTRLESGNLRFKPPQFIFPLLRLHATDQRMKIT